MTVLLQPGLYAGVDVKILRKAATKLAAIKSASLYDLAVVLGDSCSAVLPAWQQLVAEGFIEGTEAQAKPTPKMNDLAMARIGRALSREKADALIAQLLASTKALNELDPSEPFAWVTRLAVFGSYLNSDKTELGDLDIAWEVRSRPGLIDLMNNAVSYDRDFLSSTRAKIRPKGPYVRFISMEHMKSLDCPYRVLYEFIAPAAKKP